MAELQIVPDLDKAPPHVEGDLLIREKNKVISTRSKWRKRYFVVNKDKLQCYEKKELYKTSNKPQYEVRLLKVKDITESVFSGVPKKHHINCGFTISEMVGGQEIISDLLAETPDLMRYWVHALRYIKAYWSMMEVRETILNEDQERRYLDKLFNDDEDDDIVVVGTISPDATSRSSSDVESKQFTLSVTYSDPTSSVGSNKLSVMVGVNDSVRDILEKMYDRLTSSACELWVVSNTGREISLDEHDSVILYHPSVHQFYLIDPVYRVIVVFIGPSCAEYMSLLVKHNITANEIINHEMVKTHPSLAVLDDKGLFLQRSNEEMLFDPSELPCELLYRRSPDGKIERLPAGDLVIKNKSMGSERDRYDKLRQTMRVMRQTKVTQTNKTTQDNNETEIDHKRALDKLQGLREGKIYNMIDETKQPTAAGSSGTATGGGSPSDTPPLPRTITNDGTEMSPRGRSRSKAFLKSTQSEESPQVSPVMSRSKDTTSDGSPLMRRGGQRRPRPLSPNRVNPRHRPPVEDIVANESRSSGFGQTSNKQDVMTSNDVNDNIFIIDISEDNRPLPAVTDNQLHVNINDTLITVDKDDSVHGGDDVVMSPFVINTSELTRGGGGDDSLWMGGEGSGPIAIPRPSILKVILLQTQGGSAPSTNTTMNNISLSGVHLKFMDNGWSLCPGYSYHDDLPGDDDIMEEYLLPPGTIKAVYNSSQNRWHVLPAVTNDTMEDELQPSIEPIMSLPDESSIQYYQQKRVLITNIGSAFNDILEVFGNVKSGEEKKRLACDMTHPSIGHMIRGKFCTSLACLLLDGAQLHRLGGLIQYDIWKIVTEFHQENMTSPDVTSLVSTTIDDIIKAVKAENRLTNGHMKFRSFICLAISRGSFVQWLTDIPNHEDTIKKYYTSDSFLYLISILQDQYMCRLYNEMLLSLEPINFIPFQLSIDFEIHQQQQHYDTTNSHHIATSEINETTTSIINTNHESMTSTGSQPVTTKTNLSTSVASISKSKWFKVFKDNIESLNVGGTLTGPPKQVKANNSAIQQKKLLALYDCTADSDDELSFDKGDILILKKIVNDEWYLCLKEASDNGPGKTGIVPAAFVKLI